MATIPTFGSMQNDLALVGMANLLAADFGALLNRAQREEVDAYEWSFIDTNTVIYTVAPYSTGTINVAQGSTIVTGTGTAWTSAMAAMEIRFGPSGMLLPIASVTNPNQIVLQVPWQGVGQNGISYSLVQRYYPIIGAKEVTAVKQVVYLRKVSQEQLNMADPQRLSVGGAPSYNWAPAPYHSGILQLELWPVPSSVLPYPVQYRAGSTDMQNLTDIPMVPAAVLEAKAMRLACMALVASSGDARWAKLLDSWTTTYTKELEDARFADKQRLLTKVPFDVPASAVFDGLYTPSHDQF